MPLLAGKPRSDKGPHQFPGQLHTNHARSYHEDVHVIVLDSLPGRVGVVTESCADARYLVGRNRSPYAAAAEEDTSLRPPIEDSPGDRLRIVRVVYRRCAPCSYVDDFVA